MLNAVKLSKVGRTLLAVCGLVGLLTGWPVPVAAQTVVDHSAGTTISPFLQSIDLEPNDLTKQFSLQLTNQTANAESLQLSLQDFNPAGDNGGIGLGNSQYAQKYGLANWLRLSETNLHLAPGQSQAVTVTIDNRADLTPGGHYGAVTAEIGNSDSVGGQVGLRQQLTSLILLDKVGGAHYDLHLQSVRDDHNWLQLPKTVELKFQNRGNVHLLPRGNVMLVSNRGRVVARGIINDDSAFLLPATSRSYYVALGPTSGLTQLPGQYHLEVDYRYEGINRYAVVRRNLAFYNLGLILFILSIAGLIIWQHRRFAAWLRRVFPTRPSPRN